MTQLPSASPMQLLVSIVERGKGSLLIDHYRACRLLYHCRAAGRGSVASHLMDTLGFGTTERDVVLTLGTRDAVRGLLRQLKDEDRSKLNAQGIAFSLNLSGMSAILAVGLSRLEPASEKEEGPMEKRDGHSLILVSVNQGYTDEVMHTARAAGARGGTVIRARFTGSEEMERFMGITLQTEKEVLAIVTPDRTRNAILEEIDRLHGLRTDAQASVISLPIEYTARLD